VEWTKKFIESKAGVPVVGAVPFNKEIELSSRHLGLIPANEIVSIRTRLSRLVDHVSAHIDAERLLEIASTAKELPNVTDGVYPAQPIRRDTKIGVAFDEAFNFIYQDNLDLLNAYGAETIFFSPLHDASLPRDINGLYLPGGFPELQADIISANQPMRNEVKKAANDGMPIFAESGGFLYLNRSITDLQGRDLKMVGLFPAKVLMKDKFQALDYTLMKVVNDNLISRRGGVLHGHEFHFSKIVEIPNDAKFALEMQVGKGIDGNHDGWMENNVLASIGNMHFAFDRRIAKCFVELCRNYKHR
jgi:cobyrinic acid a,c-diamide synthase